MGSCAAILLGGDPDGDGRKRLRSDGGGFAFSLADIIALMVAGSSWANLFFENSQGIGAVRKSETTSKYKAFNDLTLHAPFLSAVRQNVLPRDVRDVFIQSARRNLKSVAHCEQAYIQSAGLQKKYYQNSDAGRGFTNLNYRISYC